MTDRDHPGTQRPDRAAGRPSGATVIPLPSVRRPAPGRGTDASPPPTDDDVGNFEDFAEVDFDPDDPALAFDPDDPAFDPDDPALAFDPDDPAFDPDDPAFDLDPDDPAFDLEAEELALALEEQDFDFNLDADNDRYPEEADGASDWAAEPDPNRDGGGRAPPVWHRSDSDPFVDIPTAPSFDPDRLAAALDDGRATDHLTPTERITLSLGRMQKKLATRLEVPPSGRVLQAIGTVVRVHLPGAKIGELCRFNQESGAMGLGEVVGLDGETALVSPYQGLTGFSSRTEVVPLGMAPSVEVGAHLLGAVLDGAGRVIRPPLRPTIAAERVVRSLDASPPPTLERGSVTEVFRTGVRSIDSLLTAGRGQRVGVYGSPGTGKSTLIGMLVDRSEADVVVVGLVGERGREVADFISHHIDSERGGQIVLVAATSDRPSLERLQAALVATTVAEYFRGRGLRVLLIIDSVTRLARALREIGLAAGEPPVRRGFPPSVFTALPRLFERAGNADGGSITAFYTVLVEGEILSDPIAEETRSLLDGHIVLSERLVSSGWYPAVDVLASRSRTMAAVVSRDHRLAADRVRSLMDRHRNLELMIRLGEYKAGRNAEDDEAMARWPAITSLLRQDTQDISPFQDTVRRLLEVAR